MREPVEKIGANEYLEKNAYWKPYDIDMDRVLVAIAKVPEGLHEKEWELVKIAIDDRFEKRNPSKLIKSVKY